MREVQISLVISLVKNGACLDLVKNGICLEREFLSSCLSGLSVNASPLAAVIIWLMSLLQNSSIYIYIASWGERIDRFREEECCSQRLGWRQSQSGHEEEKTLWKGFTKPTRFKILLLIQERMVVIAFLEDPSLRAMECSNCMHYSSV